MIEGPAQAFDGIRVPTLLVWGDRDEFVPRSDQDAMAAAISDARLIVYGGGGHALHWERPERFAADVARFASGVAA
jgi:pimeloyl-ACP methyl ester carboxylesterase